MTCRLGQGPSELEKNVWEKACERFRACSSLTQTARYPRQRPESQGITPSKPHPKLLPPLECLLPAAPSLQLSQGTSTNTCLFSKSFLSVYPPELTLQWALEHMMSKTNTIPTLPGGGGICTPQHDLSLLSSDLPPMAGAPLPLLTEEISTGQC